MAFSKIDSFKKTYLSTLKEVKRGKTPINGDFILELHNCRPGKTKKGTLGVFRSQIILGDPNDEFYGRQVNDTVWYESDFGLEQLLRWVDMCGVDLPEDIDEVPAPQFEEYFNDMLKGVCESLSKAKPVYKARVTTDDYGSKAVPYELVTDEESNTQQYFHLIYETVVLDLLMLVQPPSDWVPSAH